MLECIENRLLNYWREHIIEASLKHSSRDFLREIIAFYQVHGKYLSVLLGKQKDPQFINDMKSIIQPNVERLLGGGDGFNPMNEIKISFFFNGAIAAISTWYQHNEGVSTEELIEFISYFAASIVNTPE